LGLLYIMGYNPVFMGRVAWHFSISAPKKHNYHGR